MDAMSEFEQQVPDQVAAAAEEQAKPTILLIDLENCPSQLNELPQSLQRYSKVVICYASTGARIPLDWLLPLNNTINNDQLLIHKMDVVGKNAADFGICFFAGMLAQQQAVPTHFIIVSDDNDLEHVVSLLNAQAHTAERIGKQPAVVEPVVDTQTAVGRVCARLIKMNGARPVQPEALKNTIRSHMKQDLQLTERVYQQMLTKQIVSVVNNKVQYSELKIAKLAMHASE